MGPVLVVLLMITLLQVMFPREAFLFGRRWMFRDGKGPNATLIRLTRLRGFILMTLLLIALWLYWR